MSRLTTERDGYELWYDDREDVWNCSALSIKNRSLARLKAEVGKVLARSRRLDNPRLIKISSGWGGVAEAATGTLIAEDRKAVWCMVKSRHRGDNAPPEREKVDLATLVRDTPENRALIAEAKALDAQAAELRDKANAIRAAIPRVTLAELSAIEGGDDAA